MPCAQEVYMTLVRCYILAISAFVLEKDSSWMIKVLRFVRQPDKEITKHS